MDDKLLEAYCRKEEIRWQEHSKQHELEQRAVNVASDALTKRLEGMNEIRDQLREQASTFATREALEWKTDELERRLRDVENKQSNWDGRMLVIGGALTVAFAIITFLINYLLR